MFVLLLKIMFEEQKELHAHAKAIESIFSETSDAHHKAFEKIEEGDSDWPTWYANYLLKETNFADILGGTERYDVRPDELARTLEQLDKEYKGRERTDTWEEYYTKGIFS